MRLSAPQLGLGIVLGALATTGIVIAFQSNSESVEFVHRRSPIYVRAPDGCPNTVRNVDGVLNPPIAELRTRLVPSRPSEALICRYGTNKQTDERMVLAVTARVSATDAARLALDLNKIELLPPGLHSCPLGLARVDLLIFSYRRGPDINIWFDRNRCQSVDNGVIIQFRLTLPVVAQFDRLEADLERVLKSAA
jgi:hypothetical protein